MNLGDRERARLRRLVVLATLGLAALGVAATILMLTRAKTGAWPLLAGDLVLTFAVLGLAWRALR